MLPRHLLNLLRLDLQSAADQAGTGETGTGLELLRAGCLRARSEVAWEQLLLLAGLAVVWWSLRELIALCTDHFPHQGLQAMAVVQQWKGRCFLAAISGLLGLVAMFSGLTLGLLEILVVGEIRKLRGEGLHTPAGAFPSHVQRAQPEGGDT